MPLLVDIVGGVTRNLQSGIRAGLEARRQNLTKAFREKQLEQDNKRLQAQLGKFFIDQGATEAGFGFLKSSGLFSKKELDETNQLVKANQNLQTTQRALSGLDLAEQEFTRNRRLGQTLSAAQTQIGTALRGAKTPENIARVQEQGSQLFRAIQPAFANKPQFASQFLKAQESVGQLAEARRKALVGERFQRENLKLAKKREKRLAATEKGARSGIGKMFEDLRAAEKAGRTRESQAIGARIVKEMRSGGFKEQVATAITAIKANDLDAVPPSLRGFTLETLETMMIDPIQALGRILGREILDRQRQQSGRPPQRTTTEKLSDTQRLKGLAPKPRLFLESLQKSGVRTTQGVLKNLVDNFVVGNLTFEEAMAVASRFGITTQMFDNALSGRSNR